MHNYKNKHRRKMRLSGLVGAVTMIFLPGSLGGLNLAQASSQTRTTSQPKIYHGVWMSDNTIVPWTRSDTEMTYDASAGNILVFGGDRDFNPYNGNMETWNHGGSWSLQRSRVSPTPRAYAAICAYPPRGVMMFGGSNGALFRDTWFGSNWVQVHPKTSPSARQGASMAYDEATKQLILFGGTTNASPGNNVLLTKQLNLNDTWLWNGRTWVKLKPKTSPSARSFAGIAYDTSLKKLVLFGGQQYSHHHVTDLNDLWAWNGNTWTRFRETHSPTPRERMGFAYDAREKQIVLFGGCTRVGESDKLLNDTWTWDGTKWAALRQAVSPAPRAGFGMVSEGKSGRIVLWGGDDNDMSTWIFDLPMSPNMQTSQVTMEVGDVNRFTYKRPAIIHVNGLKHGDIVKAYYDVTGNWLIGQAVASGPAGQPGLSAAITVPQLQSYPFIYVTLTQPGFSEGFSTEIPVPQASTGLVLPPQPGVTVTLGQPTIRVNQPDAVKVIAIPTPAPGQKITYTIVALRNGDAKTARVNPVTGMFTAAEPGLYQVKATVNGVTSVENPMYGLMADKVVVLGPPTTFRFEQPSYQVAAGSSPLSVRVVVYDKDKQTLPNEPITFTTDNPAIASVDNTLVQTDNDGEASVQLIPGATKGTAHLKVTSGNASAAVSVTVR